MSLYLIGRVSWKTTFVTTLQQESEEGRVWSSLDKIIKDFWSIVERPWGVLDHLLIFGKFLDYILLSQWGWKIEDMCLCSQLAWNKARSIV